MPNIIPNLGLGIVALSLISSLVFDRVSIPVTTVFILGIGFALAFGAMMARLLLLLSLFLLFLNQF